MSWSGGTRRRSDARGKGSPKKQKSSQTEVMRETADNALDLSYLSLLAWSNTLSTNIRQDHMSRRPVEKPITIVKFHIGRYR